MPWVRIDESAMDHPKFVALSANAWRLWCEGMAFCQKHLTDGFIGTANLKGLRYYSPACRRLLTAVLVPGKGPLWHDVEGGIQVHDYFDWNDSREQVLELRRMAKERMAKARGSRRGSREQPLEPINGRSQEVLRGVACLTTTDPAKNGGESLREGPRYEPDVSEVDERAGRFVEHFADLFRQHRRGARYLSKPTIDFQEARALCATWDDARLETLAIAFLTTDDKFCRNSAGTIPVFRSRASWCDDKLRQSGL